MLISIIVPCYNEEKALPLFYKEISNVFNIMKEHSCEYIFVDDGSIDGTLSCIQALAANDLRVKYISFSRNFGKEAAMYAGLEASTGDYVAIMDADLQDPPHMLIEMTDILLKGEYDSVATRRVSRKGEPPIRSFFARIFYRLINRISKTEIMDGARDYRLMTRRMVDVILQLPEVNRFSKGIFSWIGFSTKWLTYENVKRTAGETKWSFFKLLLYSIDGIVAFSTAPLAISSLVGILFCVLSFIAIIFIIIRQLIWGSSAFGWSSMVCIMFMLNGIQLFCIGILGQYLSKTYLEIKRRPLYIIKERSHEQKSESETSSTSMGGDE